jgi:transposase
MCGEWRAACTLDTTRLPCVVRPIAACLLDIYRGACWSRFALGRCLWPQIVAKHDPHSFEVLPRGWVVERTFARISKHRRTTRDYEHLPASHEVMIVRAMIALMTRRLARAGYSSDTR